MTLNRSLLPTHGFPLTQVIVWWVFASGLLPCTVGCAELTVIVQPGIDSKRNYEKDDYWTAQLARGLPPKNSPYLVIVQGPDAWLSDERPPAGPEEVGRLNATDAAALRSAMVEQNLLAVSDPLLLAGRVVALLRPMEIDGASAPARHSRLWPLWEVLAYSMDADTLSVTLAAVQTLEGAGVVARIARYPAATGSFRFGVLVPGRAGETRSVAWATRVGPDLLFAVASSAAPISDLRPSELSTWTWQQVLSPGWSGSTSKVKDELVNQPTRKNASLPDLCTQAEALGFECVPPDSGETRDQTLLVLSAATVTLLGGWLVLRLNEHRLRVMRARIRRLLQREERF